MHFFSQIQLENYRNFNSFSINFDKNCTVILGSNGSGKTNLLESISLFEKGRGFRKDHLNNIINFNNRSKMFKINSKFYVGKSNVDLLVSCEMNENKLKKKLLVNGSSSSENIKYFENLFSIMWFLPEMERLFLASPSLRRNFFDRLIYGIDKNYLKILNSFKRKTLERNKILKDYNYDESWIQQIENEIVDLGIIIYRKRNEHIKNLNNILISLENFKTDFYNFEIRLHDKYFRNFEVPDNEIKSIFLLKLKNARNLDSLVGGCTIGPHKTDIIGTLLKEEFNLAQCSTGEQKAIVILIIVAQCIYLINNLHRKPIVLFDEVCSHLDKQNRELILNLIDSLDVQTFMTGTEESLFSFLSSKASYYNINRLI